MRDLAEDYSVPIAQSQGDTLCEFVRPTTANAQCAQLVQTLHERSPKLQDAIAELEEHTYRRPAPLLQDLVDILTLQEEIDGQIVSAWNDRNDGAWRASWARLDEVDEMWRSFYEELAKNSDERTGNP